MGSCERGWPHPIHTTLDGDCDPASIRWLMAWRLHAGVLTRLPKLELLVNCAAGVDKLLATPDLPPGLPIARVIDGSQAIELAQYVVHAALASGQLGGATLDVQANEPMAADDPLWSAPNLTITPHVAGQLSPGAVAAEFADAVAPLERGEPLKQPVDRARGY
jgi:phosphoglycerate dehydrogenase-like enzyme